MAIIELMTRVGGREAWIAAVALAVGCAPCGADSGPGMDEDATASRDAKSDVATEMDAGGGTDGGGDERDGGPASEDGGEGDGSVGNGPVRFVVMGDTGEGNEDQRQVATAIRDFCDSHGCDFVILLGDNIYEAGVDGPDDPQWVSKFEQPYRDVDLPFYATLGNHDYGGELFGYEQGGLGNEWEKGPYQVAYAEESSKFMMPETFYTLRRGNVGFIMLDTNSILWDNTTNGDQEEWYSRALESVEGADWVIAAGHHTYRSNGTHGNAGNYESIEVGGEEVPNPVPILDGENVKKFFDERVCGTVDMYLAGHDHNRQWLDEPDALCGAELIVSGAGAKTRDIESDVNDAHFESNQEGFLYIEIDGDTLHGQFVDKSGEVEFERTVTR